MRVFLAGAFLVLSGCSTGLVFNSSQDMSRDEMLARASHIFIGVIQKQQLESWPLNRVNVPAGAPGNAKYWRIARREVRLETVLRGSETRRVIDVYEIYWTGGTSGDWNFTQNGERALFLLRVERGKYHVVRDWWRSIFPITSGPKTRLPLDDAHPLWERIALMNYWIQQSDDVTRISFPEFRYHDPGGVLNLWRSVKLWRGLVRHPSAGVRIPACRELLLLQGWGQDECWELLSGEDRAHLGDNHWPCCSADKIGEWRKKNRERGALWWWSNYRGREERRLLTAMNDPDLHARLCQMYTREYPGDQDTGCPANKPPPATIVTEAGDVPLVGPWPAR